MLVCRKWHTIASQAAPLWTDIDFVRQSAFAQVLLTRSLGAPIRLRGRLDADNVLATAIAGHGARIRELDLWVGIKFSHPTPVLKHILATTMPQLRVLSLSREDSGVEREVTIIADSDAPSPVSFPAIEAMLLEGFLFVPDRALPQLTHLHLSSLKKADPLIILDLIRNTPALEVFDIIQCRECPAPRTLAVHRPVILSRLHSMYLVRLTSTTVHVLMSHLEALNLASLRFSSIFAVGGTHLSTSPIPGCLAARTITRVAFSVVGDFVSFHTAFHGNDLSLSMGIRALIVGDATERSSWAFNYFPAILPLFSVDELHFQAELWPGVGETLLLHLAGCMPAVSTLCVKHNKRDHDEGPEELNLARALVALLASDSPVLFPHLVHLELIVGDVSREFCELIAPALMKRMQDGRRLRSLRIRLDDADGEGRAARRRTSEALPDYRETGIHDNVDFVDICGREREEKGTGWGQWRDCVQPARHGYW